MTRVLLFSLFFFPLQSHALLYLGGYGQIGFGDLNENVETVNASQSLTHDGWTGHMGFGGRAGLNISLVTAGVVGDYAKVQWEGERQDANVISGFDGSEDYDNVFERTMVGGFVMVDIPVLPIYVLGEYYSKVKGQATYAERKGENPFAQGDEFEGSGWGIGVGGSTLFVNFAAMLRNTILDKYTLSGTEHNLPSSTFEKQKAWEVSLQLGLAIDLL